MELLNEINKMRNFMGLTPVNESYLLNEAVPPGLQSIIDDIIKGVKGGSKPTIDRVTKTAFNKFLKSNSIDDFLKDDKSSHYLIKWIKGIDGTNFRNALKDAIKNEPDKVTRMSYNAYLKNFDELSKKATPIYLDLNISKPKTPKKPVTTTKTKTSKELMPDPKNPLDIPNPDSIKTTTVDDIIKVNMKNPRFKEYMVILDNANLSPKVKDLMVVAYSKVGNDPIKAIEYASQLSKTLNEQKYGWVKRQVNKALKDPSKTISIAGKTISMGTLWYVTVVAVLAFGGAALGWITYLKNEIPQAPGSETTPDNGTTETITTEAQLRDKYPCINGEPGLKISPIVNNKCTFTYSDGTTDNIIINGGTATFEDGASICQ